MLLHSQRTKAPKQLAAGSPSEHSALYVDKNKARPSWTIVSAGSHRKYLHQINKKITF